MSDAERVAWVQPPEPIRGLDHLGVQTPCIALYGQLLPGITNVTDRARYHTFHPWMLWSFEQRYQDHSLAELRRVLRRAECLFALIAIRHSRKLGDGDDGRHGKAMVGRDKLLRIDEAADFSLDEYAALEPTVDHVNQLLGYVRLFRKTVRGRFEPYSSTAARRSSRANCGVGAARWSSCSTVSRWGSRCAGDLWRGAATRAVAAFASARAAPTLVRWPDVGGAARRRCEGHRRCRTSVTSDRAMR